MTAGTQPVASPSFAWVLRQAHRRHHARRRLARAVVVPVESAGDPLTRSRRTWSGRAAAAASMVALSALVHGLLVASAGAAGLLLGTPEPDAPDAVGVVIIQRPAPSEEPPSEPPPAPAQRPEEAAEVPAALPRPILQSPPELPPDPIDRREPAEPEPDPRPRRIVGVSLESTVTAGGGPRLGVGNTRMGRAAELAADPSAVGQRPGRSLPPGQRKLDASGPRGFVPPKRISSVAPIYPAGHKARGIEGDVRLEVEIAPSGQVRAVRVVRSSGQPELDAAATAAARQGRYSAARRNGVAVAHRIQFTVRFRVVEQGGR